MSWSCAASAVKGSGTIVNDLHSESGGGKSPVRKNCPDIGLLLADLDDLNHPYITRILHGISERGKTLPCSLRIFCIRNTSIREFAAQRHFDGLIVITELPETSILYLKQQDIPFVLLGNDIAGEDVAVVMNEAFSAMFEAMRHLVRLGHRRIGVLSGPSCKAVTTGGYLAYRQMLAELALVEDECFFKACDWGEESGYHAFKKLWNEGKRPTALIAFEDYMAYGAIRAAEEAGLAVPDSLSVIGYGNYPVKAGDVPLTTFDHHIEDLGRKSLELITEILKGKAPPDRKIYLRPQMIERGSCIKYPQKRKKEKK